MTSKQLTRKTKIYIQCSISGEWVLRTFNEQFLYKKKYVSLKASVTGEKNGMYGKGNKIKNKLIN